MKTDELLLSTVYWSTEKKLWTSATRRRTYTAGRGRMMEGERETERRKRRVPRREWGISYSYISPLSDMSTVVFYVDVGIRTLGQRPCTNRLVRTVHSKAAWRSGGSVAQLFRYRKEYSRTFLPLIISL